MDDKDVNDAFDDIFLTEDRLSRQGYEEGFEQGKKEGNPEGFHLGYHRGAELGAELGYYLGIANVYLFTDNYDKLSDKIITNLKQLVKIIKEFPRVNDENYDILGQADIIRSLYRKCCSLLKIDGRFPEADNMSF